ncbi:hypothetical protein C9I98_13610 [Photobacterium sanctipauli]|uniref:Type 4 fimbrial biogenesis protein PilX N-terminal domain-containing protein n=1 Tax=Photobacterium sanctipauli TaxID=1342794 RepID=A0A2T3NRH8_9GAMM|nr:hypothetical protein [Photobacterium sanctipauli]PSW18893.1 hypothetical protein C9I98_13610 [Photobacterium sanctipauli]
MNKQGGFATLLVTAMLLTAALLFSLASYKSVFYQIKRAQNEVMARKAHWLAEGAVECAFTEVKQSGLLPSDPAYLNVCEDAIADTSIGFSFPTADIFNIEASSSPDSIAQARVTKSAEMASRAKSGAIQSGSNMYSHSSLNFYYPDPGTWTSEGWQCIALRYRNEYLPNAAVINSGLPDSPKGKNCLPTYRTNGMGIDALLNDFVHDPNLSPFENFFGVSDENHNEVKMNQFEAVITEVSSPSGAFEYSGIKNCSKAVKDAFVEGHESIWVEGNCEISGDDYIEIVNVSNNTDGIMLLIHDGMFSIFPKAVPDDLKFQGMIFHYNYEYAFNFDDWKTSQAYGHLTHIPSVFGESVHLASFYLHGALNLDGGLILDAKHYDSTGKVYISQNALLNDSFGMTYNDSYFAKFSTSSNDVRWIKGSWHDF